MSTPADHILVVDDDPEIRHLLRQYLEKNGYQVTAVAEGGGMWMTLERSRVDLIVLDLMLPGVDGLELCRDLRARSKAISAKLYTVVCDTSGRLSAIDPKPP